MLTVVPSIRIQTIASPGHGDPAQSEFEGCSRRRWIGCSQGRFERRATARVASVERMTRSFDTGGIGPPPTIAEDPMAAAFSAIQRSCCSSLGKADWNSETTRTGRSRRSKTASMTPLDGRETGNFEVRPPDCVQVPKYCLDHRCLMAVGEPGTDPRVKPDGYVCPERGSTRHEGLEARMRRTALDPCDIRAIDAGRSRHLCHAGSRIHACLHEVVAELALDPTQTLSHGLPNHSRARNASAHP